MTTILIILFVITVFLVSMHLWTRKLTREGTEKVPQPGEVVSVRGGSIHYVEKGDPANPTLIMIHGLAGQLQHYTYALMDRLTDDFHVIAVDRPGSGYSTRDTADLARLPEQARMIMEFLDKKGVSDPVLVGHSMGGAVSLAMALDYPDKVAGLALLAPLTHEMPSTPSVFKPLEIRAEWLRTVIGNTVAVPVATKTAPKTIGAVFDPEPAPADFLDRAGGALGLRPSAFISASQDVIGVDASIGAQSQRYGELNLPGGVLFGAGDVILSPAAHGAPMIQFGFSYEQLEGMGHMIPITAPDTCAAFIRGISDRARIKA
ncbi:alpha/beta fold hydrolase [Ruegeria meonggei]|uniref:alpha/beta fold hydrolase n=1 Tax=Ruegeria meonggei TaxID=1446476 RepID=UPI00367276A5